MKANSTYISLDTAKLLKNCGIESKYKFAKCKYDESFHLTRWLNREEFKKDESDYLGIGISSYENIEIETACESYPAFTWQEILWEHADKFFKDADERIHYDNVRKWKEFHGSKILSFLQHNKYDDADQYFRKHCILIKENY